jgi:hypothetical protein
MDLYTELKKLIARLDERKVDYALCGGLAMAVHGLPRATMDIDLVVPEAGTDAAAAVAREAGFEIEARPMTFADGRIRIRRFTKLDPVAGDSLSLDLVIPGDAEACSDRQKVDWEGHSLWVVSREGLIRLKSLRGSGQDEDDMRFLRGERED